MGDSTQTNGHVNLLSDLIFWSIGPVIGASVALLSTAKVRKDKVVYGSLLAFQIMSQLPLGRRMFLYPLLTGLILYNYWKPSGARFTWKLAFVGLAALVVISAAWTTFLYFRIATYSFSDTEPVSTLEIATRAFQIYSSGESAVLDAWAGSDVEERVNVIDFNMDLLKQTETHAPAYGGDALNAFSWVVPSALWNDKQVLSEEDYASRLFHTDYPDQANSIFTAATIDFGFWGGLFYPILVSWSLNVALGLCRILYPDAIVYFCSCAILPVTLATEIELQGYFVLVRDTFVFATVVTIFLRSIPRVLRKPPSRTPLIRRSTARTNTSP